MSDEPTQNTQSTNTPNTQDTSITITQPNEATALTTHSSNTKEIITVKAINLREAILELMLSQERLTHNAMAQRLNISRSTLERHIKEWFESSDFVSWLKEEWLRLHQLVLKTDPALAYQTLAHLIRSGAVYIGVSVAQSDKPDVIVFDLVGPQEGKACSKTCDTESEQI